LKLHVIFYSLPILLKSVTRADISSARKRVNYLQTVSKPIVRCASFELRKIENGVPRIWNRIPTRPCRVPNIFL